MYKFILIIIFTLFVTILSYAQTEAPNIIVPKTHSFADNDEAENPDEAGAAGKQPGAAPAPSP